MTTDERERAEEFAALPPEAQERLLTIYTIGLMATAGELMVAHETCAGVMAGASVMAGDSIAVGRIAEHIVYVLAEARQDPNRAEALADRERLARERIARGRA